MTYKVEWTYWPESSLTMSEVAVIEENLRASLGTVEFGKRLVKGGSIITLVLTWVLANSLSLAYGEAAKTLVSAAWSSLVALPENKRLKSKVRCEVVCDGFMIYVGGEGAEDVNPDLAAEVFAVAFRTAQRGLNLVGCTMYDLFGENEPVLPGDPWPGPVRQVVIEWDSTAKEWKIRQVELDHRGSVYVPRALARDL